MALSEEEKARRRAVWALRKDEINARRRELNKTPEGKSAKAASDKKYREKNLEKLREHDRKRNKGRKWKYDQKRLKTDPMYKLTCYTRSHFNTGIKREGWSKTSNIQKLISCDWNNLKMWLESFFESWMNWDNRGVYNPEGPRTWQIDHVIPLAEAKTEEEYNRLWHYSNLMPLCSKANIVKGNRI